MAHTAYESAQNEVCRTEALKSHVVSLVNGLAPNPAEWEYQGEMGEDKSGRSHCVCGHPIVYLFPVHRGNEVRILGSTCIEHYAAYRPEDAQAMREKLAEAEALAAEKLAAVRRAKADAAVEKARAEHEALYRPLWDRFMGYRERGEKAPYSLWQAMGSQRYRIPAPAECPTYARPCDARKWHEKWTAALVRFNTPPNSGDCATA